MKCHICKDEKVTWEMDEFGIVRCLPCPSCNVSGNTAKLTEYENNKIREKWGIKKDG